mgnify:CR=1 FL=1
MIAAYSLYSPAQIAALSRDTIVSLTTSDISSLSACLLYTSDAADE